MGEEDITHLRDAARVYGSTDVSAFVREMLTGVLNPDVNARLRYVHALALKMGEQLTLPLVDTAAKGNARKRLTKRKRRPRDRTT